MARSRAAAKPVRAKSRSDIYTGMLVISLLAMIAGCVLLYLDYDQYSSSKPPPLPSAPTVTAQGGGAAGGGDVVPPAGGRGGQTPPGS